jgi:hypothetical protein
MYVCDYARVLSRADGCMSSLFDCVCTYIFMRVCMCTLYVYIRMYDLYARIHVWVYVHVRLRVHIVPSPL